MTSTLGNSRGCLELPDKGLGLVMNELEKLQTINEFHLSS